MQKTIKAGNNGQPEKPYNLQQFMNFASGDYSGYRKILNAFLQSGKQNLLQFRHKLHEKDNIALSELSHKMQPMFRYIGAFNIADSLAYLKDKKPEAESKGYYLLAESVLNDMEELLDKIHKNENIHPES